MGLINVKVITDARWQREVVALPVDARQARCSEREAEYKQDEVEDRWGGKERREGGSNEDGVVCEGA